MSTNTSSIDALVIGAGPVGLTVANELRRRNVAVRIVDKAPAIREISKALIWHVRTQEALDKIGVIEQGKAEARPLTEVVVHAYGKHIGSWNMDGIDSPHLHPLIIGQNRTQHLLQDLLHEQGASVEWNTAATEMKHDDDKATVTLHHSDTDTVETITAKYLVGCEGSDSVVRKALKLTFEGERYSGEQFIQSDCKIKWTLPTGRSYLFLTDDGYMMVIEMPNNLVRIFISLPDAVGSPEAAHTTGASEDISHEPTLDDIRQNLVRLSGIEAELSDPIWLARYRTSHRYANTFGVGCSFIVGDAGHVHVPIGGQGMNTGIQDAFNLGWKLAGVVNGVYRPSILETYNDERHPVAEMLIKGTDRAYKGILHPSELQQKAARMFGPFVMKSEPVQQFVRNTLEEITISYGETPLCKEGDHPNVGKIKPGERVLDAPTVRWSDKKTVRLSELTRSAEWTLLLFGGDSKNVSDYADLIAIAAVANSHTPHIETHLVVGGTVLPSGLAFDGSILMDAERYLHDKYGVKSAAVYLLRPDGFVGFRGGAKDKYSLSAYLKAIFVS